MAEADDRQEEGPGPHEAYGVRRVPRSRADALGQIKEELQREMARRAGGYGRRLAELSVTLQAAEEAFNRGLATLRWAVLSRFGPEGARWSWEELLARVEELPTGGPGSLEPELRAVEKAAERHEELRAELQEARQVLIIHREAMGFRRHHLVEEKFPAPGALPPLAAAWRRVSR